MADLKEQLRKEMAEGKEVKISSADLAAGRLVTPANDTPAAPAVAVGPVEVPASPTPGKDALIAGSALGDGGKAVSGTMANNQVQETQVTDIAGVRMLKPTVVIDPGTKSAFIDSMITGARFKLPFKLFGGQVTGIFRSRSQAESLGILARINREITDKTVVTGLEYAARLRNMLLAAQVEILGTNSYPLLKQPYMSVVEGPDKVTPPGWLEQAAVWEAQPEGLVSALYAKLIEFEQQYWTMVDNAGDQNFWSPVGST